MTPNLHIPDPEYIDLWFLVEQLANGTFQMVTLNHAYTKFGAGFYTTEKEAQNEKIMALLKGSGVNVHVYSLRWPLCPSK